MSSVFEHLEIARLHHQQANFAKAKEAALVCLQESLDTRDSQNWQENYYIESLRLATQCSLELDDLISMNPLVDQAIHLFERPASNLSVQSMRWHFLALWSLFHGETNKANSLIEKSLEAATKAQDNQMIARALHAQAALLTYDPNQYSKALETLEKTILISTAIKIDEITISAKILKSHIYFSLNNYGLASDILWDVFESAQSLGFHHLIANIVLQLSRIQKELGNNESAMTFNLLAKKSITQQRYPRLYRLAKEIFATNQSDASPWDLIVDQADRIVYERNKGLINFRNQHTLFDLVCLFTENQGVRFSKEDLIEKVWHQRYDSRIHDNVIYVTIKRLRILLEPDPDVPRYILRDRTGYYISTKISLENKREGDSKHA